MCPGAAAHLRAPGALSALGHTAGGVVIKDDAEVVDMAFLGFDRFPTPTHRFPAEEQEREEEFARLLRRVGGTWWASPQRASQVAMGWKEAEGPERER